MMIHITPTILLITRLSFLILGILTIILSIQMDITTLSECRLQSITIWIGIVSILIYYGLRPNNRRK